MAIALSRLAHLLSAPPETALAILIRYHYLSPHGLAHQSTLLTWLQDTHQQVTAAEVKRAADYFESTGPQPTAGFQSLAMRLNEAGYLSHTGMVLSTTY